MPRVVKYTQQELELLLEGFNRNLPLDELEQLVGRSRYGISRKLERLSETAPETWNPERVKIYSNQAYLDYKEDHGEQIKAYSKQYYEEHSEEEREYKRKWYENTASERRKYYREYCKKNQQKTRDKSRKWREENPEKTREYQRKWHQSNLEEIRAYRRKRYLKKKEELLKQMFPGLESIVNLGYSVNAMELSDSQLTISIDEPIEDLDMKCAIADFAVAVRTAGYDKGIRFCYEGNTIILAAHADKYNSKKFLEALSYEFKRQKRKRAAKKEA